MRPPTGAKQSPPAHRRSHSGVDLGMPPRAGAEALGELPRRSSAAELGRVSRRSAPSPPHLSLAL